MPMPDPLSTVQGLLKSPRRKKPLIAAVVIAALIPMLVCWINVKDRIFAEYRYPYNSPSTLPVTSPERSDVHDASDASGANSTASVTPERGFVSNRAQADSQAQTATPAAVSAIPDESRFRDRTTTCYICGRRINSGNKFCDDCQVRYQAWLRVSAKLQSGYAADADDQQVMADFNALMSAHFRSDDSDARRGIGLSLLTGKLGSSEWETLTRGSSDEDRRLGEKLIDPDRWLHDLGQPSGTGTTPGTPATTPAK